MAAADATNEIRGSAAPTHRELKTQLLALEAQFDAIVAASRRDDDAATAAVPHEAMHTRHVATP